MRHRTKPISFYKHLIDDLKERHDGFEFKREEGLVISRKALRKCLRDHHVHKWLQRSVINDLERWGLLKHKNKRNLIIK